MDNNTNMLRTWQDEALEDPGNKEAISGLANFIEAAWKVKKTPAFAKCCNAVTYLRHGKKDGKETYKGHPLDQVIELYNLLNLGKGHKKTAEDIAKGLLLYCIEHHNDCDTIECKARHDPNDFYFKNLEKFREKLAAADNRIEELEAMKDPQKVKVVNHCMKCELLSLDAIQDNRSSKRLEEELKRYKEFEKSLPNFKDHAMKVFRAGQREYDLYKEKAGTLEQAKNSFGTFKHKVLEAISNPSLNRDQVLLQVEADFKRFGDLIEAYDENHPIPSRRSLVLPFDTAEEVADREQANILGKLQAFQESMESKPEKKLKGEEIHEKGLPTGLNLATLKTPNESMMSEKPLRLDVNKKS